MKAAVFRGANQPLNIEEVLLDDPQPGEVVVKVAASGVCHSDLHFVDGVWPMTPPVILGHEGAGVIEAVGEGVTYVQPGDHIIMCGSCFCGQCKHCLRGKPYLCLDRPGRSSDDPPRYRQPDGNPMGQMAGLSTFAEQVLTHQNNVVKIPEDMPLHQAALISCGVTTGVGAALNTAKVEPGATVAVFGAGGVGLSAIQGARIAGATRIIAVDLVEEKLGRALEMGATHVVDASARDPVEALVEMTDGGVDHALECIGNKNAAEQCFEALAPGGTATIVGMIPYGLDVEIDGASFLREKKIQGCSMGSNRFRVDMLTYIDYYRQGKLLLDEMISKRGPLEDVNDCFRAMKDGEVARSVLTFD